MTGTEAYFRRLAFKQPFASKDGADKATISDTSADNAVNFPDGFPSVYSAGNGKYVTRAEMNAIGNLASQNQFFFLAGGINTFNKAFSDSIGGYPKNAVLKYLYNGFLYDVISLRDNNTFDFTINGIDDINWAYLSVPEKSVSSTRPVFFEGGTGLTTGNALLGIVMARQTGPLLIESSLNPVITTNVISEFRSNTNSQNFTGCGIMIKDLGTDLSQVTDATLAFPNLNTIKQYNSNTGLSDFSGWESLTGNFGGFYTGAYSINNQGVSWILQSLAGSFGFVEQAHYYAIAFLCADGYYTTEIYSDSVWTCKQLAYSEIKGSLKLTYSI